MANTQSLIPPNIDYSKISADKYSPDDTYEAGELRIQYNSLWKAKQKISVPEPWTPAHWDATTIAAELIALNSSYGVNEKGSYLRLPDGTQICWLNISVTDQAISDPYSNIMYTGSRKWTFPMPFISSPVVSCGIFKWGSSASWGSLANPSSISTVTLRGYDIIPREAGTTCLIQAIAIGRWKS